MGLEMSMVVTVSKEGVALEWAIAIALFHPLFCHALSALLALMCQRGGFGKNMAR